MGAARARVRRFGLALTLVAGAAVALPALTGGDSFPLSTYPMFSEPRPRTVRVAHFVGWREDGRERVLPPQALGTREVVGALQITADAVAAGPERAAALCRAVAERVDDYVEIALVVDEFDTLEYFEGAREPTERVEVARCEVTP